MRLKCSYLFYQRHGFQPIRFWAFLKIISSESQCFFAKISTNQSIQFSNKSHLNFFKCSSCFLQYVLNLGFRLTMMLIFLELNGVICYTHFYFIRTTFFGATVGVLKFLSGFTVVKNSFVLSDFGVTVKSFLIFVLNFFL